MRALTRSARRVRFGLLAGTLAAGAVLAGAPTGTAAAIGTPRAADTVRTSRPAPTRGAPATARPADPVAHDPTLAKQGDDYYLVITGDAQHPGHYLPVKRSRDLVHWQELGPVFTALPAWVSQQLGVTPDDAWAPSLAWVDGQWRLYYAVSQFGTQNSVIGLATSPTLDPASPRYRWTDRGMVIRSTPGVEDFNAIDPRYVDDGQGGAWLALGSFWGGIKLRRLDPATGLLSAADRAEYALASRVAPDAEEGPAIVRHDGYYYLFLSFDFCCRGINSDYRTMVGRSRSVTGPYLDAAGVPLTDGGGTEVLRGYHEFIGTGGADLYPSGHGTLLVNHYYDGDDGGTPRLNVRPVTWHDGWPVVGDPLNPSRSVGHGDAYLRIIEHGTGLPVADAGCGYEGAALTLAADDPADPCQQWQFGHRGTADSSVLNRFSNKVGEVAACNNVNGGRVAQWGWIGFLTDNDCQRWTAAPTTDGWTRLRSVLPGTRAWDVASCLGGATHDIVADTPAATPCQEFRFEPDGPVLLIEPRPAASVLGGPDCPAGGTLGAAATRPGCRQWLFTPAGGATYTITPRRSGLVLGGLACGPQQAPVLGLFAPDAEGSCRLFRTWTLLPDNHGTWTLGLVGTALTRTVRVELP